VEYAAIIFQEFAIRRASYEGPPLIFRFAKITDNLGATIPGSLAAYRDLIFFCDRSGFFMLQGGAQITPIGEQRVNNEFWSLIDQTNLARVTAAIDPANSLYAIAFPDTSASGGNPNHVFLYNWAVDRWAHVQPGAFDMIFSAATQAGFTLEQLDSISGSLDDLPFSLDSAIWTGIARRLVGGFDTSHTLGEATPIATTQALTTTPTRYTFVSTVVGTSILQASILFSVSPTGTAGADDSFTIDDGWWGLSIRWVITFSTRSCSVSGSIRRALSIRPLPLKLWVLAFVVISPRAPAEIAALPFHWRRVPVCERLGPLPLTVQFRQMPTGGTPPIPPTESFQLRSRGNFFLLLAVPV
jgi:hypothetical protein